MRHVCLSIMLIGFLAMAASAQIAFVEDPAKGTLTVRDGQTEVLTYRFSDELKPGLDPKYTQSCYIHPLFSLDGRALTDDFPADHFHHHGLFWVWPVVRTRGVTTGSWEPKTPPLRKHFVRWLKREAVNEAFVLSFENVWKLDEKEIVAKEIVTLRIHPADRLGRAIDLTLKVEAVGGPLELQGTPDQNKGYGGLALRGALMLTGATMTTDKGVNKEESVNTPYLWADLSTAELGVAIFVSPDHPGFPVHWLIRNTYGGFFNASWPGLTAVVLKPGEPVILRYKIYVHRGDAEAGEVSAAHRRYLEERSSKSHPLSSILPHQGGGKF
ncbi:MAG TPA: DUF6807 family protein [Candidatus Desulfaltia sp.]|nr:DUF6807 family protein [Candidatus Desulfaltia sp.]